MEVMTYVLEVTTALLETASKKPSLSHTCAGHDTLLASALSLTQTVLNGGRRLKGVVIARGLRSSWRLLSLTQAKGCDCKREQDRHRCGCRGRRRWHDPRGSSMSGRPCPVTHRSRTSLLLEIHRDISSCNTLRHINSENINFSHATHTHWPTMCGAFLDVLPT